VIAFARRVQDAVDARFGVKLTPEPLLGRLTSRRGGLLSAAARIAGAG
jgi:hypothetical protein